MTLNRLLLTVSMCCLIATVTAAPMDDAFAAYKRGDYAQALKILRPLVAQGDASAQNNIGGMYYSGYGVTQDYQEALKWYRLAAAQGEPDAIENLKLPEMITAAQQYQQTYQPTPQPKSESNKTDMTSAMSKCSDLGFKKGTEKHGDCVLKLSK